MWSKLKKMAETIAKDTVKNQATQTDENGRRRFSLASILMLINTIFGTPMLMLFLIVGGFFLLLLIIFIVLLYLPGTLVFSGSNPNEIYAQYQTFIPKEEDFDYLLDEYDYIHYEFIPDQDLLVAIDNVLNGYNSFNPNSINMILESMVKIEIEEKEECHMEERRKETTNRNGSITVEITEVEVCVMKTHAYIRNESRNEVFKTLGLTKEQIDQVLRYLVSITDRTFGVLAGSGAAANQTADLSSYEAYMDTTGFVRPTTSTRITSEFGQRIHPVNGGRSFHGGVDIGSTSPNVPGDPIYAIKKGKIVAAGYSSSMGNYIYLAIPLYEDSDHYIIARYMHMHLKPMVKIGEWVETGQQVGVMGTTGQSTGVHLHIEFNLKYGSYTASPAFMKSDLVWTSSDDSLIKKGMSYMDITPFIY